MFSSNKIRKKKKNDPQSTHGLLTTPTTLSAPASGGFCTADQCFMNGHAPSTLVETTNPNVIPSFATADNTTLTETMPYLADIIPSDLYQMMKEAAKQGLLSAFLITLSNEVVTHYLKERQYTPEQIYWINQAIRSLTLIAIGNAISTSIAAPIGNYVFTECLGFARETANYLTTGLGLTLGLIFSPFGFLNTTLSMVVGITAYLAGSQATQYASYLVKNSLFSPQIKGEKNKEIHNDEQEQERTYSNN